MEDARRIYQEVGEKKSKQVTLLKIKVPKGVLCNAAIEFWFPKEPFSKQFLIEPFLLDL